VRDPVADGHRDDVLASRHEAGHAIWAHLTWGPGAVSVVDIHDRGGTTTLADWVTARRRDRAELRRMAGFGFAGAAAEYLIWGRDGRTTGSEADRTRATELLDQARRIELGFDEDILEEQHYSRGSEAMRRAHYEDVRRDAATLWDELVERLRPHVGAIERLADSFLAAPGATLSGDEVIAAILAALEASDVPLAAP
jgi:ATP-dependent Zn protease